MNLELLHDKWYELFSTRNQIYVRPEVQERIRKSRVLAAGVGMGSNLAEALVRIGFEHITLVDADRVEVHNLNRQSFEAADVGTPKVIALAKRLRAINPYATINVRNEWLGRENVSSLVEEADLVFDTIDFLDLAAIVTLHDETKKQKKDLVSLASAGFGAVGIVFLKDNPHSIREYFGLSRNGPISEASYAKNFANLFGKIAQHLDPLLVQAMQKTFTVMEDGKPCPAPHLVVGAASMGALGVSLAVKILGSEAVTEAPHLILFNIQDAIQAASINLAKASGF